MKKGAANIGYAIMDTFIKAAMKYFILINFYDWFSKEVNYVQTRFIKSLSFLFFLIVYNI